MFRMSKSIQTEGRSVVVWAGVGGVRGTGGKWGVAANVCVASLGGVMIISLNILKTIELYFKW